MYALVLFEYHFGIPANSPASPLDRITYRQNTLKSFRRTLLRTVLHNFGALAPVTHLDGVTYGRNCHKPVSPLGAHSYGDSQSEKSQVVDSTRLSLVARNARKSFRIILLPPRPCVSHLESHSYKNIGVGGPYYFGEILGLNPSKTPKEKEGGNRKLK
jgi:hypothetical protein